MADTLINKFVRELRIPGPASFSRRGEIPSGQEALLVLILEIILLMQESLTGVNEKPICMPSKFLFNGYDTGMGLKLFWP